MHLHCVSSRGQGADTFACKTELCCWRESLVAARRRSSTLTDSLSFRSSRSRPLRGKTCRNHTAVWNTEWRDFSMPSLRHYTAGAHLLSQDNHKSSKEHHCDNKTINAFNSDILFHAAFKPFTVFTNISLSDKQSVYNTFIKKKLFLWLK